MKENAFTLCTLSSNAAAFYKYPTSKTLLCVTAKQVQPFPKAKNMQNPDRHSSKKSACRIKCKENDEKKNNNHEKFYISTAESSLKPNCVVLLKR